MKNSHKAKFLVIIEARMNSSRLPGKVCIELDKSKPALEILIDRIRKSKYVNEILIATTRKKIDNKIVKIAKKNGCLYYRGSENKVLRRVCNAIKNKKINSIIQLTGDNPLIDPLVIDYVVNFYLSNYPKYDFVTNNNLFNITRPIPLGMILSVFKKKSILKVNKLANKKEHFEHTTLFFYSEGKNKFKIKNLKMPKKWCPNKIPRLTLDTQQDLILIKKIYKKLKKINNFSLTDVLNIFKKNQSLLNINNKVEQKIPKI